MPIFLSLKNLKMKQKNLLHIKNSQAHLKNTILARKNLILSLPNIFCSYRVYGCLCTHFANISMAIFSRLMTLLHLLILMKKMKLFSLTKIPYWRERKRSLFWRRIRLKALNSTPSSCFIAKTKFGREEAFHVNLFFQLTFPLLRQGTAWTTIYDFFLSR